jgi:hypothetical protein
MAQSETILPINTHPDDSTITTVTGDKFKGDGYYGRSDGLHTIQVNLTGFTGQIEIQGTLAVSPTDDDWFNVELATNTTVAGTVDTTGAVSSGSTVIVSSLSFDDSTANNNYNFTGNYVWVRAYVSNWTSGSINKIMLNH